MSEGLDPLRQGDRSHDLGRLLAVLGWDIALHRLAEAIPDARQPLGQVAQCTDAAADKVLRLVDDAQPACQAAATEAAALSARLAVLAAHPDLGVGEARAVLAEAAAALSHQARVHHQLAGLLGRIMLAQDFQDLSGQVIRKVVGILDHGGQPLQQLLSPSEAPGADAQPTSRQEGPAKGLLQQDVDDRLASMRI